MKVFVSLIIALIIFGCTPIPNGGGTGIKIKGKVIRITCATTVIQVLDSAYFSLGETWPVNGTTDTVEHAAQVFNKCEFPASLNEGKEFYFKVIPESQANHNCAVCAMYDYPPSKGIWLRVVN